MKKIKDPVIHLDDGKFLVELKKMYYQKEAVFAAAYKFTGVCTILIEPTDENSVGVFFKKKRDKSFDIEKIANEFCNEVLDQQLRLDLEERYGNLREIIYKKAFLPLEYTPEEIEINEK
jgi:His-Xaa-Ser system protein HxsD